MSPIFVEVSSVNVPGSSKVGYAVGRDLSTDDLIEFTGSWRAMLDLQEALGVEPITVAIEDWQIVSVSPAA